MRNYNEALEYSKHNPTEVVEFKQTYSTVATYQSGYFLNGKPEGVFEYFRNGVIISHDVHNSKKAYAKHTRFISNGRIISQCFSQCPELDDSLGVVSALVHGEYVLFNEDGTHRYHYFCVSDNHIEELDYLANEPRDDAFYVTLALHGIDSEYTL